MTYVDFISTGLNLFFSKTLPVTVGPDHGGGGETRAAEAVALKPKPQRGPGPPSLIFHLIFTSYYIICVGNSVFSCEETRISLSSGPLIFLRGPSDDVIDDERR